MFNEENRSESFDLIAFLGFFAWLFLGASIFSIIFIFGASLITNQTFEEYVNGMESFTEYNYIFFVISHTIGSVAVVLLYKKYLKDKVIDFKSKWIKYLIIIIGGFILLYFSNILITHIYDLLGFGGKTSQNQEQIVEALHGRTKTFVIIYTVILAPIFEEILFRKLLFTALKKCTKFPIWAIVLIVSTLFAFMHVSDLESLVFFPQYFVLAIIITTAYAISKENLFVSTGLHFLNNLVAVIEILL